MSFADDIKKWQEKAFEEANKATNNVVESLFTEVVDRSPMPLNFGGYATGHMKNQWYTASGGAYSSEVGSSASVTGADSINRIKSTVSEDLFYRRDNVITLSNNTEQASYAEHGWLPGAGTNGWVWKGSPAYEMVSLSLQSTLNKYST